jgi:hypothetical protein
VLLLGILSKTSNSFPDGASDADPQANDSNKISKKQEKKSFI